MNATVEPLEGNKVKLTVSIDETEFEAELDAAFKRIAREVRMPGFRPGKAPRRLLEARIGTEAAREEALREALPKYYSRAVLSQDVDVIAAPEIDITAGKESGPVEFDAVVEVRPVITVPGYGGLRVTLPSPVPSDEEIDAQLERMRSLNSTLQTVERAAAEGDRVVIDIAGMLDGEPQPGLTADEYTYEIGSGMVTPELDEHLIGASAGDELEFDATHPDEEEERALRFAITVREVREQVLPDLDDTWVQENTDFETVEDLRADLRSRMGTMRRAQGANVLREKVGQALAELVDAEIPESLTSMELNNRLQDMGMRLQQQGINLEQYLMMTGRSQEDLLDDLRNAAAVGAKVDLALRAVAEGEGLVCTDDDLDHEIEEIAAQVGQKVPKVRRQLEQNEQLPAIRSDITKRKALEWLLERVEIVDEQGNVLDRSLFEPDDHDGHDHGGSDHGDDADDTSEGSE